MGRLLGRAVRSRGARALDAQDRLRRLAAQALEDRIEGQRLLDREHVEAATVEGGEHQAIVLA